MQSCDVVSDEAKLAQIIRSQTQHVFVRNMQCPRSGAHTRVIIKYLDVVFAQIAESLTTLSITQ